MSDENQPKNQQQSAARIEDLEPEKDAKGGGRKPASSGYQTGGSSGAGLPGRPGSKGYTATDDLWE